MPTITDFQLLQIIYKELGALKDDHNGNIITIQTDLRLFIQESRWHRELIMERLDKLEKRKPINHQAILSFLGSLLKSGWSQIVIFLLLLAGNIQLLEAAKIVFRK